jgi:hypothetical protein
MTYACEWIRRVLNDEDVGSQYPCEWVRKNWHSMVKTLPYPCEALEQYFLSHSLLVKPSNSADLCYCTVKTSESSEDATLLIKTANNL